MSKYFDMIAKVNIDITSPVADDSSFDGLLIVGPLPKSLAKDQSEPAKVGVYSSLEEVEKAGWKSSGGTVDPVGVAALVAFSQNPKPAKIFIAPVQTDDENGSEAAVDTVKRALGTSGWYVVCTAGVPTGEYEEVAKYIETTEKNFCYTEKEKTSPTVGKTYFRSFGIYADCYDEEGNAVGDENPNNYLNVGWCVRCLRYQPGAETWAYKQIALCTPSDLDTTEIKTFEDNNISYFVSVGGKNITMGGKVMAGEWIDIIRFRDWLKNDMQVRIVNAFSTSPKLPFTDKGISVIQNLMNASLKAGQNVGGIAEDEYDEDGNLIAGYSTSVPKASSFTATQKATRKLTGLKFKGRLAGAIHFVDGLDGTLSYEI